MTGRPVNILLHILCSLAFLSFPFLISPDLPNIDVILRHPIGLRDVISHVLMVIFFYLNFFYLVPTYYFNKRYFWFYAVAFLFLVVMIVFPFVLLEYVPSPNPRPPFWKPLMFIFFNHNLYLFLAVFFVSLLMKTSKMWKLAEKEKQNAELLYLKAQINPHFLFNTLNGIYALAIQNSEKTAEAIVKLSEMMRYIITDASPTLVALKKELLLIENYIDLQRLRLGNTVQIDYTSRGNLAGKEIAPLILIHFIENAFKHGVNPDINSFIRISIVINDNDLIFKVSNDKVNFAFNAELNSRVGIENSRSRLQLLYPARHDLLILDEENRFTVELKMILA